MKTKEFLNILQENQHLELVFSYLPGEVIAPGYHITEVKNIRIDSVDCGGQEDQWNETIIQLWESPEKNEKDSYMSSLKAMGILKKVDSLRPMDKEAIVKFEYSNARFHTSQMSVSDVVKKDRTLTISLSTNPTDCKAKSDCGVPEFAEVNAASSCDPDSGCC